MLDLAKVDEGEHEARPDRIPSVQAIQVFAKFVCICRPKRQESVLLTSFNVSRFWTVKPMSAIAFSGFYHQGTSCGPMANARFDVFGPIINMYYQLHDMSIENPCREYFPDKCRR